jgi:hypothetical protein
MITWDDTIGEIGNIDLSNSVGDEFDYLEVVQHCADMVRVLREHDSFTKNTPDFTITISVLPKAIELMVIYNDLSEERTVYHPRMHSTELLSVVIKGSLAKMLIKE